MNAVALDMGGSHIGCAVIRDTEILASGNLLVEGAGNLVSLLEPLALTIKKLLIEAKLDAADCIGIGVGFPGIVDFRTGTIHATLKKYEDAQHMDLAEWCRQRLKLTLAMENDARMALLGEQYAGSAQGCFDCIMMTLGTGIGGAAMMNGLLVRGKHAQAACIGGHLPVDFKGRLCACGNIGCAEAEASGWSMPLVARDWPGYAKSSLAVISPLGFRELFDAALQGDEVATAVRNRCLEVWASNIVANVHAYDPEIVVIGGGVIQSADIIIPFIQDHVNKHAWSGWGKPEVRAAKLGSNAGLLGAIPLLLEIERAASL